MDRKSKYALLKQRVEWCRDTVWRYEELLADDAQYLQEALDQSNGAEAALWRKHLRTTESATARWRQELRNAEGQLEHFLHPKSVFTRVREALARWRMYRLRAELAEKEAILANGPSLGLLATAEYALMNDLDPMLEVPGRFGIAHFDREVLARVLIEGAKVRVRELRKQLGCADELRA